MENPIPVPGRAAPFRPSVHPFLSVLLFCCLAVCACARSDKPDPLPYDMPVDPPSGADLLTVNTYAGDALSSMLLQRAGVDSGILATSLVRLDALDATSSFGRLTGQQIASRIAQHGFMVLDIRLTSALALTREGEFMLSRDMGRLLAATYDAHAVLVGTYSHSGEKIFVSVRVLRLTDGAVLAAYEYYLPFGGDTARLLGPGTEGGPSVDTVWHRYNARGQAFPASPTVSLPAASPEKRAAAPARTTDRAASGTATPLGRESIAPRDSLTAVPLPEQIPLMSGGKRIQP
jgi:hypothetical protein